MKRAIKFSVLASILAIAGFTAPTGFCANAPSVSGTPQNPSDFPLVRGGLAVPIVYDNADAKVVGMASHLFAEDVQRVSRAMPVVTNAPGGSDVVVIGTVGHSANVDELIASGKLNVDAIKGGWERYEIQVVEAPFPNVARALVIVGGDRRGTAYGVFSLSEAMGVSPWYWWADVPPRKMSEVYVSSIPFVSDAPAVRYRGIFINDEDWGFRPWAAKNLDVESGNVGPKAYAKVFELLLRLRANYLWPAMHPGTHAFNSNSEDAKLADDYAIVMGSSHCEQMLRNNISEWDEKTFGEYNFVTNPDGVLKYWEQRIRENGKFENVYTLGMRGIHDGAMPGGGTEREKAARLQTIIADQRDMIARNVSANVAAVPQIFCPYKEVLPLYRLMTNLQEDVTLVWPDDNFGYIRQFSNASERKRSGGAGVYYHASYWGAPHDYLWLCSTPPALIAEEMTKAFDYGADKVWMLNVGDIKPAELDIEFFLNLARNPGAWNGTNTYDLLKEQIERDFGATRATEITSIMAEYYRLNFQRKPEHIGVPAKVPFSESEAGQRVEAWKALVARVDAVKSGLSADLSDAFFELVDYPVTCAALQNEKFLAPGRRESAQAEIDRLTDSYNNRIAGGKWRSMMSDNPHEMHRNERTVVVSTNEDLAMPVQIVANVNGADFTEDNHCVVMDAAHASQIIPGKEANWRRIVGLGYDGKAMGISPNTAATQVTAEEILSSSPCLQYKIGLNEPGNWRVLVRALPTFSVDTGKPQRYAVGIDDERPQIVSLPLSQDERNSTWQENVMRDAALTASTHNIAESGLHTLKIWMVDPGIVIDTIMMDTTGAADPGYVWPAETRHK